MKRSKEEEEEEAKMAAEIAGDSGKFDEPRGEEREIHTVEISVWRVSFCKFLRARGQNYTASVSLVRKVLVTVFPEGSLGWLAEL